MEFVGDALLEALAMKTAAIERKFKRNILNFYRFVLRFYGVCW